MLGVPVRTEVPPPQVTEYGVHIKEFATLVYSPPMHRSHARSTVAVPVPARTRDPAAQLIEKGVHVLIAALIAVLKDSDMHGAQV